MEDADGTVTGTDMTIVDEVGMIDMTVADMMIGMIDIMVVVTDMEVEADMMIVAVDTHPVIDVDLDLQDHAHGPLAAGQTHPDPDQDPQDVITASQLLHLEEAGLLHTTVADLSQVPDMTKRRNQTPDLFLNPQNLHIPEVVAHLQ